jgi:hypothetical protein
MFLNLHAFITIYTFGVGLCIIEFCEQHCNIFLSFSQFSKKNWYFLFFIFYDVSKCGYFC